MSETPIRICRVYPRMDMGGAENAILQLLQELDRTHMVVTHMEGLRAAEAQAAASRYSFLEGPRFAPLMAACADSRITHLHTINDHLLGPLAAQLAGVEHLVQTIHNDFDPVARKLVDHSIVVGHHQLSRSPTPSRVSFIPNGIRIPEALPDFQFWCEPGIDRPLRLVELRRPDKLMSLTLDQIAGTGALDGLDFEGTGIGFDTPSTHPRIQNIGAQANPYPILAQADLLIMGTTTETFGRTVYEAMAWGTLPITTPIPAFRQVFSDQEVGYFSGFELETGARELRKMIDALAQDPRRCRNQREANHRHILQEFSVQCMSEKTESLYGRLSDLPRPPRNFGPEDLEGTTPEAFGFVMDNLLSTEDFYCQEAFTALPPAARGIVLWSLVKTGRALPDQRVPLLARAMQLTGPRPILCMDLASELLTRGDLPRAEALYAQAASLDPADVEAHLCRVDIRIQRGDRPGAFQALREARQANPEVPYLEQLADSLPPS